MKQVFNQAILSILLFLVAGCTTPSFQPTMKMVDAEINPESVTEHTLRMLPGPPSQLPVAVYGLADETGAFKPSEGGQTLSRALTQAPTPILIKALHDAGERSWFSVIERENLNNLIKERQIIQEMRSRYLGEKELNKEALPSLKFAGLIIEGAITGYDTNTRTGGAGARYLGVGGSTQYREDAVSVYLRAVSVKTGEVLISVNSQQRVASVSLQGDAFRFVSFQKLLEAEAGITMNQPRHLAVRQAIEKAVYGLIVEGVELGLWSFEDQLAGRAAIDHYRENFAPFRYSQDDGRVPAEFYAARERKKQKLQIAAIQRSNPPLATIPPRTIVRAPQKSEQTEGSPPQIEAPNNLQAIVEYENQQIARGIQNERVRSSTKFANSQVSKEDSVLASASADALPTPIEKIKSTEFAVAEAPEISEKTTKSAAAVLSRNTKNSKNDGYAATSLATSLLNKPSIFPGGIFKRNDN